MISSGSEPEFVRLDAAQRVVVQRHAIGHGDEAGAGLDWRTKHLVECVDLDTGRTVPVECGLLHTRDGLQMALQLDSQGAAVLVSLVAAPKLIVAIRESVGDLLKVWGHL
jgi:hypothetical protein